MIEYGSMNSSHAFWKAKTDGPSLEASDSTRVCTSPATCPASIMRKVHPARRPICARPTPFHRKSGRTRSRAERQNTSRRAACTTMPVVAVPASSAIMSGVQPATWVTGPENRAMKARKPAIETMLLTIGAHVNGP